MNLRMRAVCSSTGRTLGSTELINPSKTSKADVIFLLLVGTGVVGEALQRAEVQNLSSATMRGVQFQLSQMLDPMEEEGERRMMK